ncbi:MAG TPA: hypothetical protein VFZ04_05355 [Longimicrobiales bacterium]
MQQQTVTSTCEPDVKHAVRIIVFLALPGCANTIIDSKALQPGSADASRITELAVYAAGSDVPVLVAPEVLGGFNFLYHYIDETEFVLCLEGARKSGRVYVTGFRLATITRTTIGSAAYEPCTNANYIGTAHNHPPVQNTMTLCGQSSADRITFQRDTAALVDIILCGHSQFVWVLKDGRSGLDNGTGRTRPVLASQPAATDLR